MNKLSDISFDKSAGRIVILILMLFLPACASYHPMKIGQHAIDAALKPPDIQKISIEARRMAHPLLKPVAINLQNGLSPDEAAVLSVLTNPALKSIRDQRDIAEAEIIQAGILPNPQLSANYDIPTGGNTAGTVNAYGLSLGWDFMSLIGRKDRIAAAKSEKAAVDLTIAWEEWQVAESAKLHLLHVLWADRQLSLLQSKKNEFSQNLNVIRKAVDMGAKTVVELAAAESASKQMEITISGIAQEREQERLLLNQTLGLPPEAIIPIEQAPLLDKWPILHGKKDFISGIPKRRPDLLALNMGYESQEARLRAAVLSQFPKIGINLNQASDTGDVHTTGLGVNVEFPFFDRAQGAIAIETATRKKLYDEYMSRIFDARADIAAIGEKITSGRSRIEITKKSINALQDLVNIYKIALDQGNADILSYYQAQSDLIAKHLELLQQRQAVTDLGVAFETAAGVYFPFESANSNKYRGE